MDLKENKTKNFKDVFSSLNLHDCLIEYSVISDEGLTIILDYYNWEDCIINQNAPWYKLEIQVKNLIHYEVYGPNPNEFQYEIDNVVFDELISFLKTDQNTTYDLRTELLKDRNYLDMKINTHCSKDIALGYNGYIKILGSNCCIRILEERKRSE